VLTSTLAAGLAAAPLQSGEPLPIGAVGAAVLLVSLAVTVLWVLYLVR
jgi:hypothetical protein